MQINYNSYILSKSQHIMVFCKNGKLEVMLRVRCQGNQNDLFYVFLRKCAVNQICLLLCTLRLRKLNGTESFKFLLKPLKIYPGYNQLTTPRFLTGNPKPAKYVTTHISFFTNRHFFFEGLEILTQLSCFEPVLFLLRLNMRNSSSFMLCTSPPLLWLIPTALHFQYKQICYGRFLPRDVLLILNSYEANSSKVNITIMDHILILFILDII